MKIVGQVYQEFRAALMDAFDPNSFDQMLLAKLGERRHNLTLANDFPTQIHQVLQWVDMVDRQRDLLVGATQWRPTNAQLQAFAQRYNFTSIQIPNNELETMLKRGKSMLNVVRWRERLGAIEVQTCQVKIDGKPAGSGFLVGKQAVITNYHVIEPVLKGRYQPNQIEILFDYKVIDDDGQEVVLPGTPFKLADGDEWKLLDSPYSEYDMNSNSSIDPDDQHLDFALLKLNMPVGDMGVGDTIYDPWSDVPKRGWVETDSTKMRERTMEVGDTVFVFQHPKGDPLSLDFDTIKSVNAAQTRVQYMANTEGGSSGSGCYDRNFNLIALHHLGASRHNQGIPFDPIRRYIEQHGQLAALS